MRHVTDQGLDLTKSSEGKSLSVYLDDAGFPTVGFGHLIRPGEVFDRPLTDEEADELLRQDLGKAERAVLRLVQVPLSDGQFDALTDFTFNLGGGAFQRSTLRMKLNRGDHPDDVAEEFLKWTRAGGRVLKGLVKRRQAEKKLFITGGL